MDPVTRMLATHQVAAGKGGIEKFSDKELRTMLSNPKLPDEMKENVVNELCKRIEAKIKSGKGAEDDARQLELLPRLKEGTITAAENDELGALMGIVLPKLPAKPGSSNIV